MKVVIPLAGFGTRLRPHTYTKPKPLVNVAGKPVLGHILDKLHGLDISEIIFITGYLGDQIEDYVRHNYAFPARFVEQKELLGQAHAISLARDYVDGPTLIIFVDTIFEADLSQLATLDADGAIYVKEVEDPRRFGVVLPDERGLITRLVEKPTTFDHRLAVIGVYWLRDGKRLMRAIADLIAQKMIAKGEYWLADALQIMINDGCRFVAVPIDVWEDCGQPDTVLKTNRYLLDHGHANTPTENVINSVIIPPVNIAPTAQVRDSIVGPYVTIGTKAIVKHTIVRDSIIDQEAVIEHTTLTQSLIGRLAVVSGGYRRLNVGDSSRVDLGEQNHG